MNPRKFLALGAPLALFSPAISHAQVYYYMGTPVEMHPFYRAERALPADEYAYYQAPAPRYSPPDEEDAEPPTRQQQESEPEDFQGGSRPTVRGNRAVIRHGIAYAPSNAPEAVKRAIWAANSLRRKPYKWGGGHGSFQDSGYDCSGTVSYALHYAGALSSPLASSELVNYGERGRGRWITIYAGHGHTFAVIAGLRLDTTGYYGNEGPRWRAEGRETWGFAARHPVGL